MGRLFIHSWGVLLSMMYCYPLPCVLVKPYVYADTLDVRQLDMTVVNYNIDQVVHFSALLSAVAEQNVALGLQVLHNL